MKKPMKYLAAATLAATLAACGQGAGSSSAGDGNGGGVPVKIKIAHGASETLHMHKAWLEFKRILEEEDDFEVEIYPSSQFGNDAAMVESTKIGDITIATPPSSFLVDEVPTMAFIELPYAFPSREVAVKTLEGEWAQEQLEHLEVNGLYGMGYLENGTRHITSSGKKVVVPADIKGMKFRTMQVPAHVYYWNDIGAVAEGAPFAEVYTNLSTGRFDGQENPIALIYSQKFHEVQDYLTLTSHVYTSYVPVMNADFWNALNEDQKELITQAFSRARELQLELIGEEEAVQLQEIADDAQYPTEVIELTDDELQEWIDSAQPTLEKYYSELGVEEGKAFDEAVRLAEEEIGL